MCVTRVACAECVCAMVVQCVCRALSVSGDCYECHACVTRVSRLLHVVCAECAYSVRAMGVQCVCGVLHVCSVTRVCVQRVQCLQSRVWCVQRVCNVRARSVHSVQSVCNGCAMCVQCVCNGRAKCVQWVCNVCSALVT